VALVRTSELQPRQDISQLVHDLLAKTRERYGGDRLSQVSIGVSALATNSISDGTTGIEMGRAYSLKECLCPETWQDIWPGKGPRASRSLYDMHHQ
jgi:hypothetical protein